MLSGNESINPPPPPPEFPFSVSDAALARIAFLLSDEPVGTGFVVSVLGGGCSGFQYHFDLKIPSPEAGDFVLRENISSTPQGGAALAEGERGNVTRTAYIVVDEVSLGMLKNSTLDYEEDLASAGFVIKNPNATAKCGCGNSFSVAF